jgi:hypothetical protein
MVLGAEKKGKSAQDSAKVEAQKKAEAKKAAAKKAAANSKKKKYDNFIDKNKNGIDDRKENLKKKTTPKKETSPKSSNDTSKK